MTMQQLGSANGNGAEEPTSAPHGDIVVPQTIVKRDGRIVPFDVGRIENAMARCFASFDREPLTPISELAERVVNIIAAKANGTPPTVEGVQDIVEMVLQAAGEFEAAKRYILYRAEHAKEREKRPIPEEVRRAFADSRTYFPTALQQFQFFDKYSRFNYELGRRETWIETVDRAVDYLHELAGDRLPPETYQRIRRAILEMRAMPSMRLLAMAGPAARRNNITIYNCSYQPVESIDSFVEALTISMSGCGVGYSVESRYVENFPRVKRQTGAQPDLFIVEDSAEGWADALRYGLETWFEGGDVRFDLSLLRPAGAPLRTKGGRASGPEPLRVMLEFVRSRIMARQGSFLRPIDAHDMMCAVGNAAVSGGVRRTAMLALFDYDDDEMRLCKSGDFERENSQRWNANNSAVWPAGGLTQPDFIKQFLEMVESERGEPGIFSRAAANVMKPARRQEAAFGTNPCVAGDTWVLTDTGPRQVKALAGVAHTAVIDGQRYETTEHGFWETGVKPVFRLVTREGYTLRLTANHNVLAVPSSARNIEQPAWVEAGSLKPGDKIKLHNHREFTWEGEGSFDEGWLLGSLVGDGVLDRQVATLTFRGADRAAMAERAVARLRRIGRARDDLQGFDQAEQSRTTIGSAGLRDLAADYGLYRGVKTITPFVEQTSSAFHQGFLQGLFDADGVVAGTQTRGVSVRLARSDLDLLRGVQRMLLRLGIASTISTNRRPADVRLPRDGAGGNQEDHDRADYELIIAHDNLHVFAHEIGFSDPEKQARLAQKMHGATHAPNRERFVVTVQSLEPDGEEVVYDCSVPGINAFDANGLYVHNCGEINLRPHQFCNLTAAVARVDDTFETLREKVEVATIIGTIQSMATHFPGLRPIWRQNCEEERLLGVDITGQMDSPIAQDAQVKRQLREIAIEVNRQTAAALGINQSAAITCVKPSGNCRPWYSLTSTSAGLLTLQELFADHPEDAEWAEVQGDLYALQGDQRARITRTYNNGVSPTVRIRMSYGLVVESTPQHRWFVAARDRRGKGLEPVNEWVMAADLCPDDVLDVNIGAYTSEAHAPLTAVRSLALKMRGNATPIKQPGEMNEDIAWLLGYLWGDGCLSPGGYRIRFMDSREENLLKAQRILREQFGLESTMHAASEKRHAWVLEVASVYLWHWLIKNNAFTYFEDQIDLIPQCVRASARNDILAFLAGLLDADGWSGLTHETRTGRFTLSTADRMFAQHVQDVSWAVGVPVGCSLNDVGDSLQNRREMYLLTGCVHVVPDAFEVLLRNSTKLQATASLPGFTRWEWETSSKRNHVGKIIEVTPGDPVPTYDVEVEGNHWFYAGAVKSHNSSQLLDCSSGLHARWAPYYIRNVRVAAHSPIYKALRDAGVPMDPENGQTPENANTWVIHFPVKAPEGAITRKDRSAIEQCEYWLQNKLYWTEHNPSCFTAATRVITDRGLMSFGQLEDLIGDDRSRTPRVLGKAGTWVQATFHALGEQEIWELVVEQGGVQHTIQTTANHLWPITSPTQRSGESTTDIRTTRDLPVGSNEHKLLTVHPREQLQLDLEGVLHGITFGGGTSESGNTGRTMPCSVVLCNDQNGGDTRALASLFVEAGFAPALRADREQIQFDELPPHWKRVPDLAASPEYLRGFVAGWLAASSRIASATTITSADRAALVWLQHAAPRAGLATSTRIVEIQPATGSTPERVYALALASETIDAAFFILQSQRERFVPAQFAKHWKIVAVRPTGRREPVYCMEVVDGEPYFALEGNILTHNCTITYRPDEVIDLMKWVWDHRDQIGGLSFLPSFDAQYAQMPYVEITREEYEKLVAEFPEIDFSKIYRYEETDLTNAAQELACSSGACEIDP